MSEDSKRFQRPYAPPEGATQVILVRHGSAAIRTPDESPFELVGGHSDPPLSRPGLHQAKAVCARLEAEQVDALFVSTLRRTSETAAPLAKRTGLQRQVLPELREVNLGEWEGRLSERATANAPLIARLFAEQSWEVIPGAESMVGFQARVCEGLERVVAVAGPNRTAAAFVHGGVIAEACRMATDSRPLAFLYADNASLTRLVHTREGLWMLRGFNDVTHLSQIYASERASTPGTGWCV